MERVTGEKALRGAKSLQKWANQGVLLLNTILTVEAGQPKSHAKQGWETFTSGAIKLLIEQEVIQNKKPMIFLLWGKSALESYITSVLGVVLPQDLILMIDAEHPAYANYKHKEWNNKQGFEKANEFLKEKGQTEINWLI